MMRPSPDIVAYVEEGVSRADVLRPGETLLLAVSGGRDSVAMLLALCAVRDALPLRLVVGHVNHGLRGAESDGDEEFVRRLAETRGLPVLVERVSVRPSEEAAREARFAALRRMAEQCRADRIALAHTATDRAETLLMNLLRGSGLEGLAAMPAVSGDLVRPLLALARDETAAYCRAKGVQPRQDSTNLDQGLLRNRVRLSLLPLLERDYQPGVQQALLRLAEIAETELDWTRPLVRDALEGAAARRGETLALSLAKLAQMPPGLCNRVLREAAAEVRGSLHGLTHEHLVGLSVLVVGGKTGQRAGLPGLWAERTAGELVLRSGARALTASFEVALSVPGEVTVAEAGLALSARLLPTAACDPALRGPWRAQLDAALVGAELVVRSIRPGDRIVPLGMSGTKKVRDFLADKKIPRAEREGIAVVATTEGEVLWVVGHRVSDRAKVTEQTQQVAELIARPLADSH